MDGQTDGQSGFNKRSAEMRKNPKWMTGRH